MMEVAVSAAIGYTLGQFSPAAVGGLVIYKYKENFIRAKEGEEILVSDFAGTYHDFHH